MDYFSILQKNDEICYLCGKRTFEDRHQAMHWHHIFYGISSNKKRSEKYGLMVRVCGYACHEYGPNAVHRNSEVDENLKQTAQRAFEKYYAEDFKDCEYKGFTRARAKFVEEFGKNHL